MKLAAALALGAAAILGSGAAPAPDQQRTSLWRLDCGRFEIKNLEGRGPVSMPVSCYLVARGDELIMFDAGLPAALHGNPEVQESQTLHLDKTLKQQFETLGLDPAKVSDLVVSHYHGDHHGQADLFPNARLSIGAGDAAALREDKDPTALDPWLKGKRPVQEITADRDLAEGVKILFTPGHTPGHLSLFVRLSKAAYVLSGDLIHQHRQLEHAEASGNHVDKVRGKAEIERVKALANKAGARIIVGHDAGNIDLLPAFPEAAR